jgi:hypothetical protein
MHTEPGKQCFFSFLAQEYASENLEFYVAAEDLLLLQSKGAQWSTIRLAYTALLNRYVKKGAVSQINIPAMLARKLHTVEEIDGRAMIGGEYHKNELIIDLVTKALQEISDLLEFGSFPRFQNSALYREHMTDTLRFPYYPGSLKF